MVTLPKLNLTLPVAAAVVGILIIYGLGERERALSDRDAALQEQFRGALGIWRASHQRVDSISAVSKASDHARAVEVSRRRVALAVADTARSETQRLRDSLSGAPTLADTARVRSEIIVSITLENDSLRAVLRADSVVQVALLGDRDRWKDTALRGVASLDSVVATLKAVNAARRCRIGVGPLSVACPSRTISAVFGAGLLELLHLLTGHP